MMMMACDSVECGCARKGMSCECKWYGKREGVDGVGDGVCQVECEEVLVVLLCCFMP